MKGASANLCKNFNTGSKSMEKINFVLGDFDKMFRDNLVNFGR